MRLEGSCTENVAIHFRDARSEAGCFFLVFAEPALGRFELCLQPAKLMAATRRTRQLRGLSTEFSQLCFDLVRSVLRLLWQRGDVDRIEFSLGGLATIESHVIQELDDAQRICVP